MYMLARYDDIDIVDDANHDSSTTAGVLVTADDISQGSTGNCWMLACIGAVAHVGTGTANAGKAIENLFIDPITNDQIYGIKFSAKYRNFGVLDCMGKQQKRGRIGK